MSTKRNPYATALRSYTKKVMKNKKKYTRKEKHPG